MRNLRKIDNLIGSVVIEFLSLKQKKPYYFK